MEQLRTAALNAIWRQWAALGANLVSKAPAKAIIDPEALVLISLALRERERRLWDLLCWLATHHSALLSVQRMKNIAARFPDDARQRLREFTYVVQKAGEDHRWKSLPTSKPEQIARVSKFSRKQIRLTSPACLMLRLRHGLGVGIKADLLSMLIGLRGDSGSVKRLASGTSYAVQALKRAADEMASARLIRTHGQHPTQYSADPQAWLRLLGLEPPGPEWRFWHPVFAFVSETIALESNLNNKSAYIISSTFRDLVEDSRSAFDWNGIRIPDPSDYPGESFLQGFVEIAAATANWLMNGKH